MKHDTLVFDDDVLANLLIRNNYCTASEIAEFKKIQKQLLAENTNKTLEEIIISGDNAEFSGKVKKFFEFLRIRWHGIIFSKLGMANQSLLRQDVDRALVTQRSLFLLKNKILHIDELLSLKKRIQSSAKDMISHAIDVLTTSEYHKLAPDALQYLVAEDEHALQWRMEYLQGMVGNKYRKTIIDDDVNSDEPVPNKMKQTQKVKWSLNELNHEPQDKQPSQAVSNMPESKESNKEEPSSPVSEHQEMKDLDEDHFDPHTHYGVGAPNISITRLTVIITAIICVVACIFIFLTNSGPKDMLKEIAGLWENKKYPEAEQRCRDFCTKYPKDALLTQVYQYLQDALLIRADISQRQEKWEESEKLILEALTYQSNNAMTEKLNIVLKEVQSHIQEKNLQNEWKNSIAQFRTDLSQAKLNSAKNILQSLSQYRNISQTQQQELLLLEQELKQAQQKNFLTLYRFYTKEETNIKPPEWNQDIQFTPAVRLPLQGRYKQYEYRDCSGLYFTTVNGYLYALSANDGSIQWIEFVGSNQCYQPILFSGPRECTNLSLADRVMVVSYRNSLKMLTANNGNVIWETVLPEFISVLPVTYRDKIYVGCLAGMCYQMDSLTGQIEGVYRTASSAIHPPCIDRSQKVLYITTSNQVYGYRLQDGKMTTFLESPDPICAPVIAISPYLIVPSKNNATSFLGVYQIPLLQETKLTPTLLKKITILGDLRTPCIVAGGLLAYTTNSQLSLYGIHPNNPQECLFAIGAPIPLEDKSPVFLQFTHFLHNLLLIQNKITVYELPDFTTNNAQLNKQFEASIPSLIPVENLHLSSVVLRSGDLLFYTQISKQAAYCQVNCISIKNKKATTIWQRQISPVPATQGVAVQDKRMMVITQDGTWHDLGLNEKNRLTYRMIDAGLPTYNPKICYIPEGEGYWAVTDRQANLVDAVTGWVTPWRPEIMLAVEFGKPIYYKGSVFACQGSGLFAFSAKTGQKTCLEYSEFRGKPFLGNLVFSDNSFWVGNDNGMLYRFQMLPDQPLPFLQKTASWKTQGAIRSEPLIHEGIAYFGSEDKNLYAVDFETQKLIWKFTTQGSIIAKPVLHQDTLYFGSEDRRFYAISRSTGNLIWKQQFYGKISYPCIIQDNSVLVTSQAGEIRRFDLATGQPIIQWNLPSPLASPLIFLDTYTFAVGCDGFIYMLK